MKKIFSSLLIAGIFASLFVGCRGGTPTPTGYTREQSQEIAREFVESEATYVFDGIAETLELTDTRTLSVPYSWEFTFEFDSAHSGYGDRTGQVLLQVITHHKAVVTVIQGVVTEAVMMTSGI